MSETTSPVPVVRIVVTDTAGRVLILKRAACEYGLGAWCLPGGKIDYGDTAEATVAKELKEETALSCGEIRFLFFQDSLPLKRGKMHCLNLYFSCIADGEVRVNEESSEYAWIGPEQLDDYDIAFRNDEALGQYWSTRRS